MLIAFDGMDGAGKTTQISKLVEKFHDDNISCYVFDMGGFAVVGKYLKELKNGKYMCEAQLRELLYYFEGVLFSRYYNEELKKKYDIVLCDRWLLTYFAYGINNGMDYDDIVELTNEIERPRLTFCFLLNPEVSLKRINNYRKIDRAEIGYINKYADDNDSNKELFLSNQSHIMSNYKKAINDKLSEVFVINADDDIERIHQEIYISIKKIMGKECE